MFGLGATMAILYGQITTNKPVKVKSNADGKTVSSIGEPTQLKLAVDAIESLLSGSMHGHVYKKIESARRQEKFARLQLWENQDVF